MAGGCNAAIIEALPAPLGSLRTGLFLEGIPLIAEGPAPNEPALRIARGWAYEPAEEAKITTSARASLTEAFGMGNLHMLDASNHVGPQFFVTTK